MIAPTVRTRARQAREAAGYTAEQAAASVPRLAANTLRHYERAGGFSERHIRILTRLYGCEWTVFLPYRQPDSRSGSKRTRGRRKPPSGPRREVRAA